MTDAGVKILANMTEADAPLTATEVLMTAGLDTGPRTSSWWMSGTPGCLFGVLLVWRMLGSLVISLRISFDAWRTTES